MEFGAIHIKLIPKGDDSYVITEVPNYDDKSNTTEHENAGNFDLNAYQPQSPSLSCTPTKESPSCHKDQI